VDISVWDMDSTRDRPDLVDEYRILFVNRQGFPEQYSLTGVRVTDPTRYAEHLILWSNSPCVSSVPVTCTSTAPAAM